MNSLLFSTVSLLFLLFDILLFNILFFHFINVEGGSKLLYHPFNTLEMFCDMTDSLKWTSATHAWNILYHHCTGQPLKGLALWFNGGKWQVFTLVISFTHTGLKQMLFSPFVLMMQIVSNKPGDFKEGVWKEKRYLCDRSSKGIHCDRRQSEAAWAYELCRGGFCKAG